ncbi:hypothetical protein CE457_10260 [Vreelandella boliviensis LC1]|uniref:Uncharacterized protein n=1 Tax=Vreelandella boliviensis LC1 TaxID=1072583 RepID=A0ABX4GAG4_9GAMM|nr:hypothetical protein CE457_10260 [Halomonas boliviensis LC1]
MIMGNSQQIGQLLLGISLVKLSLQPLAGEGRFPRGRCEPVHGRYFRHLTAMDGGNAGIVGNIIPALEKDPRITLTALVKNPFEVHSACWFW